MDVGAAMGLWAAQPPSPAPATTPGQGAQRDPTSALRGPVLFWPGAEEEGDALGRLEDHEFSFTLLEVPEKGCRQGRGFQMSQILQQTHPAMHTLLFFFLSFSCSMWDLVPWPGIEPGPPALGAGSLSH